MRLEVAGRFGPVALEGGEFPEPFTIRRCQAADTDGTGLQWATNPRSTRSAIRLAAYSSTRRFPNSWLLRLKGRSEVLAKTRRAVAKVGAGGQFYEARARTSIVSGLQQLKDGVSLARSFKARTP